MIVPTKHEALKSSVIVMGAEVLRLLALGNLPIESAYDKFRNRRKLSLDQFYDTILFLWLADLVEINSGILALSNVSS